jgi:hypothetical protein
MFLDSYGRRGQEQSWRLSSCPGLWVRRMSAAIWKKSADAGRVLDIEPQAGQSSSAADRRLVATIAA